jgi:hypothetical protein
LDVTRFAMFAVPVRFMEAPERIPDRLDVPDTLSVDILNGPV